MTVEEIKASEAYRKVGFGYLIVRADELNRLIRENIALKKDLQIAATDGEPECGICAYWNGGYMSACCEACVCGSLFEWQGVQKHHILEEREADEMLKRLVARERK